VIFGTTGGSFGPTAVNWLGTDGADTHSDGGTAQTLVAGAGNDTLTASAASVLYGGAGNDSFTVNQAMITALQSAMGSGGNVDRLARIDGGSGIDTLVLTGGGLTLDFTQIANQAGGNPIGGSRLSSIEKIDLTGSGNNTLKLKASDVFDLSEAHVFDLSEAHVFVTTGPLSGRHQLLVKGNIGDAVNFADGDWGRDPTPLLYDGLFFNVWNNHHSLNTVYVQLGLTVLGVA